LALMFIAAPAAQAGGPAWLAAIPASPVNANAQQPDVASDTRGDVVAVWSASDGTNDLIESAYRQPGSGNVFNPKPVTADGSNATAPRVAMNGHGAAVAVWQTDAGQVQAAYMQPGAVTFGAPQTLRTDASTPQNYPMAPQVAIDDAGDAVVVWQHKSGGKDAIEGAYAPSSSGTFGAFASISIDPNHDWDAPAVAMDGAGEATVVWYGFNGVSQVWAAQAPLATPGTFGTPVMLSDPAKNAETPAVSMDGAGAATVVWQQVAANNHEAIFEADSASGGTFTTGTQMTPVSTVDYANPQVAENARGDTAAAWADDFFGYVYLDMRPAGGTFGAQQTPTTLQDIFSTSSLPAVTVEPNGDAVAAWERTTHEIAASVAAAGGTTWAAPQVIGGNDTQDYSPQLASDGIGDVLATWFDTTANEAQVAAYDGAPPTASNVDIPAVGTAGQPISLSAVPIDIWSGGAPSQTVWKVNGQAVGTGSTISYTFPAAGQYQLEFDLFDTVGNELVNSRAYTVLAPQVQQPAPAPTPLPPPVLAAQANVTPTSGTVLVRVPGSKTFVSLPYAEQVPTGSVIDATHGTVTVTVAEPNGKTEQLQFFAGEFTFEQARSGVVTALLTGGTFAGCPVGAKHAARIASKRGKSSPVRSLWANGHGNFQTKGRYAAGSVSGTEWFTQDRCDGTYIKVTRDAVLVTDLVNRKRTKVRQGHSILALAPGF
jgi:hypothetical protein